MKLTPSGIPGVLILEPRVLEDPRGFIFETYNRRSFKQGFRKAYEWYVVHAA